MTELLNTDHEHSEAVIQAAQWLADQAAGTFSAPVPELQRRFPLSALQACEAIAIADNMRKLRRAFS